MYGIIPNDMIPYIPNDRGLKLGTTYSGSASTTGASCGNDWTIPEPRNIIYQIFGFPYI